jgi:Tfp pilus assembly protein PilV
MRLILTAAAAALVLAFAGTSADAKKAPKTKSYTFNISCPAIAPVTMPRGTCTAKGASKEAARASCQSKNLMCYVGDKKAKKAKKAKKSGKKAAKKAKK